MDGITQGWRQVGNEVNSDKGPGCGQSAGRLFLGSNGIGRYILVYLLSVSGTAI